MSADPLTMMMVATLGANAIGSVSQGIGANKQAEEQAETLKRNSLISEIQANQVKIKGQQTETALKRRQRQMQGTQIAKYAKAGILPLGSPLEVMSDTFNQFETDIAVNRYNTDVAKEKYRYEADYLRRLARGTKRKGKSNMFNSLLTGVFDTGMGLFAMSNMGMFGKTKST